MNKNQQRTFELSYSNAYLREFDAVFFQILKEKNISPEKLHLEIIDEEPEEKSIFEPAGVDEVLEQLAEKLNYLTIYTKRPEHFSGFVDKIYEENGLMPILFSKKQLKHSTFLSKKIMQGEETLVLDFEWNGPCYFSVLAGGKKYIPIYKKPWKMAENLDIIIPFGYNTVIVKSRQNKKKKPVRDRFEEAFYSEE